MTNVCTICTHPQQRAIDADIVAGNTSDARVAVRYGVPAQTLRRHRRQGHVEGWIEPNDTGADLPAGSVIEVLRESLDALRGMKASGLSAHAQVSRIEAIRKVAESLGKLEPPDLTGREVRVGDVAGLPELIAAWAEALERVACPKCGHHNGPLARELMADATRVIAPQLMEQPAAAVA